MTPDWGWAPPDPSHQVLAPLGSFPIRPPPSPTQGAPGRRIAAAAQLTSRHRHSLPLGTKSGTPAAKTGSFPPVKAGARPHCTTPAPPVPGPAARCGSARRRAAPAFPATLRRARTKPQVRRRVPLSPSPAPEAVSQPPSENRSREAGLSRALRPLPVRRPRGQLTLAGPPWGGGGSGSPRPRTHGRPDKDQPERSGPAGAGLGLAGTRGLPWPRATRRRAVTLLPAEHKETIEGCGPPPPPPRVSSLWRQWRHTERPQHHVGAAGVNEGAGGGRWVRRNRARSVVRAVPVPGRALGAPVPPGAPLPAPHALCRGMGAQPQRCGLHMASQRPGAEPGRRAVPCGDTRWHSTAQHGPPPAARVAESRCRLQSAEPPSRRQGAHAVSSGARSPSHYATAARRPPARRHHAPPPAPGLGPQPPPAARSPLRRDVRARPRAGRGQDGWWSRGEGPCFTQPRP